MAVNQVRKLTIEESLPPHPPEISNISARFQYRGRLFRPFSATNRPLVSQDKQTVTEENSILRKPPRAQSAKGRLEKQSADCDSEVKRLHSVVNLNLLPDIPSPDITSHLFKKETQRLTSVNKKKCKNNAESNIPAKFINSIQPSVQGLKVKQKGLEDKPALHEVWINFVNPPPPDINKKIKEQTDENKKIVQIESSVNGSHCPSTLNSLQPWLRHETSIDVIGVDPRKCYIFLSRDYESEDLLELPPPQTADQDLPYTHCVETPRKPEVKKPHRHSVVSANEKEYCHRSKEKRNTSISFIRNVLSQSGARAIVKEIQELEDLMEGIVSQNSQCSFVQFQDEIYKAQNLAKRLTKKKAEIKALPKTDTFGLLQLYKEHEELMKVLMNRREKCLLELAKLCANVDSGELLDNGI